MNVLFVIPARSQSRRLKDKNVKFLGKKPLMCWSMDTALEAATLLADGGDPAKIIVSTDSEYYRKIANNWWLEARLADPGALPAPFLRPPEISTDCDTGLVVNHALLYAREEMGFDADVAVTLQPTSPYRDVRDILLAHDMRRKANYHTVFSVRPITEFPRWMFVLWNHADLRIKNHAIPYSGEPTKGLSGETAQDQPMLYVPNGSIYVTRSDIVERGDIYGNLNGCIVMKEPWKNVDIEEEIDYKFAQFLLEEGYVEQTK